MPRPTKAERAVATWDEARIFLETAREAEMRLRLAAIAAVFGAGALVRAGTTHAEMPDGADLQLEIRRGAKVDKEKLPDAMAALRKAMGAVKAKLVGERLIIWKPNASLAELGKLAPEHAKIFDGVIIVELSTPSLKLTPPKAAAA